MAGRWRALPTAQVLAALVVGAAVVLRWADFAAGRFPIGSAWLPLLTALAGLITSGLLRRRVPPGAWFATVAAAAIAAIEVIGVVRGRQSTPDLATWPFDLAIAEGAVILAAGIAAAYALRRAGDSRLLALWRLAVFAGVALVAVAAAAAVAGTVNAVPAPDTADVPVVDLGPLRSNGRLAAAFIALATLGGAWLDLVGPARRAWKRSDGLAAFPRALADELLPTSVAMRRRGVEDERARLAAELHARILPDLRRAAEAAEATGSPSDPLAVGLRNAVEDVEELMHGRHSVVLETYGLVAALEWLAERTQQRSPLVVELELDGEAGDSSASVPRHVERAAFRVALLAIDNVARHAGATRAVIRLFVDQHGLDLAITDDGTGIDLTPQRRTGRGLADMRAAAAEIGAALQVERLEPGTRTALAWERGAAVPDASDAGDRPIDEGDSTARRRQREV